MANIIPDDVIWSRGARFHLHALLACTAIMVLSGILAIAVVLMAGPLANDPPIRMGLVAFGVGAVCTLLGALAAGWGQFRVLNAPEGSDALTQVEEILGQTQTTFGLLPRVAIAGCVIVISGTLIWLPSGFWGAVVGAFVVIQIALLLGVVRKTLLGTERLRRQS